MNIDHKTEMVKVSDGAELALHSWIPKKTSGRVVHICHGMAEHALRYDRFALFLAEQGIIVFAHDQRGHGQSIQDCAPKGHSADKDGLQRMVLDVKEIIEYTKKTYSTEKYILFGHSFGSFISQVFIINSGSLINSLILSGTTSFAGLLGRLTVMLSSIIALCTSVRKPSSFLTNTAFGSYNKHIVKPSSPNAWLSSDGAEVKKYDDSPLCGFQCTPGFYRDLGTAFSIMNTPKNMRKIPKHITILLIAGSEDPVGGYGRQVKKLYDAYQNLQFTTKIILYPKVRHESLNDIHRETVYKDVLSWIQNYS